MKTAALIVMGTVIIGGLLLLGYIVWDLVRQGGMVG